MADQHDHDHHTPDPRFMEELAKALSSYLSVDVHAEASDFYHDDAEADHNKDFMTQFAGKKVLRNPPVAVLYEHALRNERGSSIVSSGALLALSGSKTGRSPKDKRIVDEEITRDDVWWGPVNMKLSERSFKINRERALDYLNTRPVLFVIDAFAGWDPKYRIKVRIVCERAYHALFMTNMLIRPTPEELKQFGDPDYIIYNAGKFPCNKFTEGVSSSTSVSLNLKQKEMVILGTEYAGEMKKGVLTIVMYLAMKQGNLPLHSSCNEGDDGRATLFFGLSGTGKTTLSADPERKLIGDDEHVWTSEGVYNVEGGCYAKCVNLSKENEPEIYGAIRFGAVLENVVTDKNRVVDYTDISITENTRASYPLEFIPNSKIPAVGPHPSNVVLLTCDAFGVLPPVSKLNGSQAMYHFISGYTAKVAGTEVGITEPTAAFSACYGSPFLVLHPVQYAKKLAEMLETHSAPAWLINTGWTGGAYGTGSRIKLKFTRAIIDAIHNGSLIKEQFTPMPVFGLLVPTKCQGVPDSVLNPREGWKNKEAFDLTVIKLAKRFKDNFAQYKDKLTPEVLAGGPQLDYEGRFAETKENLG